MFLPIDLPGMALGMVLLLSQSVAGTPSKDLLPPQRFQTVAPVEHLLSKATVADQSDEASTSSDPGQRIPPGAGMWNLKGRKLRTAKSAPNVKSEATSQKALEPSDDGLGLGLSFKRLPSIRTHDNDNSKKRKVDQPYSPTRDRKEDFFDDAKSEMQKHIETYGNGPYSPGKHRPSDYFGPHELLPGRPRQRGKKRRLPTRSG